MRGLSLPFGQDLFSLSFGLEFYVVTSTHFCIYGCTCHMYVHMHLLVIAILSLHLAAIFFTFMYTTSFLY